MSNKIDFFDISDEQIKNDGKSSGDLMTLPPGDTLIRLMPPWNKGRMYYKSYKMHFSLGNLVNYGLEVDGWFNSPCLADVEGKCPICALANKAKALGTRNSDPNLLQLSRDIRAKQQYIANVVDMQHPERGVQRLTFGAKVYNDLQAHFTRKGNITHPVTGFNLIVTKREIPNQKWFDYSVSLDERVDISKDWDTLKGQLYDLDLHPNYPDPALVAKKIEAVELIPPNSVLTTSLPTTQVVDMVDLDKALDDME